MVLIWSFACNLLFSRSKNMFTFIPKFTVFLLNRTPLPHCIRLHPHTTCITPWPQINSWFLMTLYKKKIWLVIFKIIFCAYLDVRGVGESEICTFRLLSALRQINQQTLLEESVTAQPGLVWPCWRPRGRERRRPPATACLCPFPRLPRHATMRLVVSNSINLFLRF